MPQYMIHSCNQRKWYVEEYLVPSMQEQGIIDIVVHNDDNNDGPLPAFLDSILELPETGGTWHLQDDVIISHDFAYQTHNYDLGIVCGFCSEYDAYSSLIGDKCTPEQAWYSFPCIRIPNQLLKDFKIWLNNKAIIDQQYRHLVKGGKHDDYLFHLFIETIPDIQVHNLFPNLVDHIDFLLGGSVVNKIRSEKQVRAKYFNDLELVNELERQLNESN